MALVFVIFNIHTYIPIGLLEPFTENVVFLAQKWPRILLFYFYVAFWNLGPVHESVKWGGGEGRRGS